MKKLWVLVPVLLLAAVSLAGCGAPAEKLNAEGNEAFAQQNYEAALVAYTQAQAESPELAEPYYNAANVYYRQTDYGQSQQQIERALVGEEDQPGLDQNSYYNLGNTFYQGQQYEAAIEAYKEALRLDPGDMEAKQNLELALRQLRNQQQQQEDKQQQDRQEQSEQQDPQQDQQEQSEQQDPQQGEQPDQQNDEADSDQQQDSAQDQQKQGEQPDQQEQSGKPDQPDQDGQPDQDEQQDGRQDRQQDARQIIGLSAEQARQLFEAAAQKTKSLEEALQQILVFPGAPPAQDW